MQHGRSHWVSIICYLLIPNFKVHVLIDIEYCLYRSAKLFWGSCLPLTLYFCLLGFFFFYYHAFVESNENQQEIFLKKHILITQILMCIYETSSRLLTPVSKIFKHCRLVKNIKCDFVRKNGYNHYSLYK